MENRYALPDWKSYEPIAGLIQSNLPKGSVPLFVSASRSNNRYFGKRRTSRIHVVYNRSSSDTKMYRTEFGLNKILGDVLVACGVKEDDRGV